MKHRYTAAVIVMLFVVPMSVTAQDSATKQMAQILGLSDFSKCVSSSTPSQNLSQPQTDMEKCMQDCMKGGKQASECESECGAPSATKQ
jgi:hypothetical protein